MVYVVTNTYSLPHESGFRFDDPSLGIDWPLEPSVVSDKDLAWGLLSDRIDEVDNGLKNITI